MQFRNIPIQKKIRLVVLMTSGLVLFLTCGSFFVYEFFALRQSMTRQMLTLSKIIANNSTAALAFDNKEDAIEILEALKAEPSITMAVLFDVDGKVFSMYSLGADQDSLPAVEKTQRVRFNRRYFECYQPVVQGHNQLGTLYLRSTLDEIYERLQLYGGIAVLVFLVTFFLAMILSMLMEKSVSVPIISLAETAKAISERKDFSVRALKRGNDELGLLTDAFNQMLSQIQEQNTLLSNFNAQLEEKVEERTLELENVNKELEAFSYSISHDLRSPLRAINGYAVIIMEDYSSQLDPEASRLLNQIMSNAEKMSRLIDDLLEFSRLGKRQPVKVTISMKRMVMEIWEELMQSQNSRNIQLLLSDIPDIQADDSAIRQVWHNLISNALKYTGHNVQTVVEIGFEQTETHVTYYVKDNGVGFDMAYYNKLFGVFQRLHSDQEFEGTGVGLAIVRRIINKHEGTVWAHSEPNKGATFYFTLPFVIF